MLCKKIDEKIADVQVWDNNSHLANIKFDGERIQIHKSGDEVILINRRGNIKNSHYLEIVEAVQDFPYDFVIDGEMISWEDDFNLLSKRSHTKCPIKQTELRKTHPVKFVVFDVINMFGKPLMNTPLSERIKFQHNFLVDGKIETAEYKSVMETLREARIQGREGIVIKDMNGLYENRRSDNWLKCKFWKETTIEIVKYTSNNAGIRAEDSDGNVVQISGHQHLPVKEMLDGGDPVVVEIQYQEITKAGRFRMPSYRGSPTIENNIKQEILLEKRREEARNDMIEEAMDLK